MVPSNPSSLRPAWSRNKVTPKEFDERLKTYVIECSAVEPSDDAAGPGGAFGNAQAPGHGPWDTSGYCLEESSQIANNSSEEARRLRATESFEERLKKKMGIRTDVHNATSDNANATADKGGSRERNPVPDVHKQETAHKALESPKAKQSRKSHQSLELPRSTKPELSPPRPTSSSAAGRPRRRRVRPAHGTDEAPRNHIEYDHPLMPSLPPPLGSEPEPTSATVPNSEDSWSSSPPPPPEAGRPRQSKGGAVARAKKMARSLRMSKRNASNCSIDPTDSLRSDQDMSNGSIGLSDSLRRSEQDMLDGSIDLTDSLKMSEQDTANGGNHGLSKMCVICLDLPSTHAFVSCGHVCACRECSQILMETTGECPICNQEAIMAMEVRNVCV